MAAASLRLRPAVVSSVGAAGERTCNSKHCAGIRGSSSRGPSSTSDTEASHAPRDTVSFRRFEGLRTLGADILGEWACS